VGCYPFNEVDCADAERELVDAVAELAGKSEKGRFGLVAKGSSTPSVHVW
jgi:hypothetical protein